MIPGGDLDGLADETFTVIQLSHHRLPATVHLLPDNHGCRENLLKIVIIEHCRIFLNGKGRWASLCVDLIRIVMLDDARGVARHAVSRTTVGGLSVLIHVLLGYGQPGFEAERLLQIGDYLRLCGLLKVLGGRF